MNNRENVLSLFCIYFAFLVIWFMNFKEITQKEQSV